MIEIEYEKDIIENHSQKYPNSCIPSCVEMVLKLSEKVNSDYYELQDDWGNNSLGNFKDFDNKTIEGVTFHHEFNMDRGADFPIEKLTKSIDSELNKRRFVCISLESSGGWHMWVIYKKNNGEYTAFSKSNTKTIYENNVMEKIMTKQGTDILIYELN